MCYSFHSFDWSDIDDVTPSWDDSISKMAFGKISQNDDFLFANANEHPSVSHIWQKEARGCWPDKLRHVNAKLCVVDILVILHKSWKQPLVSDRADWTGGVRWDQRSEGNHLFIVLYFEPDEPPHSPGDIQEAFHHHLSITTLLQRQTHRHLYGV